MTRRETIVELARTLPDVIEPIRLMGGRRGKQGSRSLEMSHLYHAGSYRALEDALAFMSSHRKQYAIAGCNLGQLRWHFVQRYILGSVKTLAARQGPRGVQVLWDGQWQSPKPTGGKWELLGGITAHRREVRKHGQTKIVIVQEARVESWHPRVHPQRVELALDWLDRTMPHSLYLPRDWDEQRAA